MKNTKRIVCVCRAYPTQRPGGMLFVAQDRAEALASLGYDVHVLTTGLPGNPPGSTLRGGVTVWHLDCRPCEYTREFAVECLARSKELAPDVLHLDSFDRDRPWWLEVPRARRAVTMHGFGWGSMLTRWQCFLSGEATMPSEVTKQDFRDMRVERERMSTFDRIIAISRHECWLANETYGLSAALVYNPIAAAFFAPRVPPPSVQRVFYAAAISGQGPRGFASLASLARSAGVEIREFRDLPREKMPDAIDQCAGMVLPTRYCQGYDLGVAECLARGRPVFASAVGSYFAEAQAGLRGLRVLPPNDPNAWAAALSGPLLKQSEIPVPDQHRPKNHALAWLAALA